MLSAPSGDVLKHLQVLFQDGTNGDLTDGELLDRFASGRDESAFAILVERHGAMVLRVCRAVLADEHDAHDAFQATFLVLVRRARSIDRSGSVGPWLFGVCHKIAVRARADAVRRRVRERRSAEMRASDSQRSDRPGPESWPELYAELGRLPEKYRAPLVLCYLEGQTTEEAAQRLGCPRGTILSRLARARERLRGRLARRGLALPVAAISASLLPKSASAVVPASLADATIRAAVRLAANGIAAGTTSAAVTKMMEGMISSMKLTQLKIAAATLLAVGVATGAAVLAQRNPPSEQQSRPQGPLSSLGPKQSGEIGEKSSPGTALVPKAVGGRILKGHASTTVCVAFSPDGKLLASGDASRIVKLWDPSTGNARAEVRVTPRQGQHAAVMALAFSHHSALLGMACDDLTIRLRDVVSGEERSIIPQNCFANTVAFAPDGRTLASAGTNPPQELDPKDGDWRVITLWDVASSKVRTVLAGHTDGISSLAFSADGTTIVSGSYDQTVRLWQAATGKHLASLKAPEAIHGVAISPDGRVVAAATGSRYASNDERTPRPPGLVILWDVATWREQATLPAHEGSARTVAFSPDGKILASGGQDGLIKLWDAQTSKVRAILQGHQGYVYSVAFAPDGKTLASSGLDSTVRLWYAAELLSSQPDQP
jgi:RNA polymerase sigma factor (sigma-70 family)